MKKTTAIIYSIVILSVFFIGTLSPAAAAGDKTYELKFQCMLPEIHPTVRNVFKPWMKAVEEKSGGRLKIHYFPQKAIVKEEETFDAVKNGLLDIGAAATGRTPGKFPHMDLITLPLLFPNSETASVVLWELYQKYPEIQKEFKGSMPLFLWTSGNMQVNMIKGHVKTLADFKGKKIVGWAPGILNLIKTLGANPVQLPAMDTYLGLERGIADGVVGPYSVLKPFKIYEVAKFHTDGDLMMLPFFGSMNPAKFNSLPEDLQKLLRDTTGAALSRALGKSVDDAVKSNVEWVKKQGNAFHTPPLEEQEKWKQAVTPLREKWLKKMEAKGFKNIRAIVADAEKLIEANK